MDGFWVVLHGAGGELFRLFALTRDEIKTRLVEMAGECDFYEGDRITVETGWREP